jgi:hypothetical protein
MITPGRDFSDLVLIVVVEGQLPLLGLGGELDLPSHPQIIMYA